MLDVGRPGYSNLEARILHFDRGGTLIRITAGAEALAAARAVRRENAERLPEALLLSSAMTARRSRAGGLLRDRRTIGVVAAAAVFLGSWAALGHSFYAHGRISDTGFYQGYGLQMRLGAVPYRDFEVDYPPGSLPAFLVPTYVGHPTDPADYDRWFARLMEVCGLATLGLVMLARAPARGIAFVAISRWSSGRSC